MKLKSFGCSFIYGTDLADNKSIRNRTQPSQYTWPALLAHQHGLEYECWALPGIGNQQILQSVLDHTADESALCVVGWTYIDRFDYIDSMNCWQTIRPDGTDSHCTYYYKNFHSQFRDKFNTLTAIKLAADTLRQRNCAFIMTCMDTLIFETQWHTSPGMLSIQNEVRPLITTFNGKDFKSWSADNGFPISKQGQHPLEAAHQAAHKLICSYNLV